jgi:PIN domain nuclease of toxin-antitoxin system
VNADGALDEATHRILQQNESRGIAVSIISCWEVAKKVEVAKLQLDRSVEEWIEGALA